MVAREREAEQQRMGHGVIEFARSGRVEPDQRH
jgi:hypothetical protein